jgi:hypothetical protein
MKRPRVSLIFFGQIRVLYLGAVNVDFQEALFQPGGDHQGIPSFVFVLGFDERIQEALVPWILDLLIDEVEYPVQYGFILLL